MNFLEESSHHIPNPRGCSDVTSTACVVSSSLLSTFTSLSSFVASLVMVLLSLSVSADFSSSTVASVNGDFVESLIKKKKQIHKVISFVAFKGNLDIGSRFLLY